MRLVVLILLSLCFVHSAKANYRTRDYNKEQITCIAVNSYFEARSQGFYGEEAVDYVVMNRVSEHKDLFGLTPCEVVYKKEHDICQFSWVCSRYHHITNWIIFNKELLIATLVYYHAVKDPSNGATFYHTKFIHPDWKFMDLVRTARIGDHIFYAKKET